MWFSAGAATIVATRFLRSWARKNARKFSKTALTTRKPLKLAVLNPRDKFLYNSSIIPMLEEMFADANVPVTFSEFDVYPSDARYPTWDPFDGVIVPGSAASAYDDELWIERLCVAIRDLVKRAIPTFGICFGHQVMHRENSSCHRA